MHAWLRVPVSLCLILQLFYLKDSRRGLSNNESLRQQLRDICISAAVDGKPTVLVITSSIDIRRQDWEDIYKLMNEGTAKKHNYGLLRRFEPEQVLMK